MGPSSLPGLSQLTPNPGIWVQEDQVYILILRKLCLSSPDPFQPKGERQWRVSWAQKDNHTNTDQNQVMSLWAFCTIATINTWKAFDSHISKTCHKARASPLPTDLAPSLAGGGLSQRCHSAPARLSWSSLREETSTESSHKCEGNYSIQSQQPLREGVLKYLNPEGQRKWVSQITLFYREGNWHFRWRFSPVTWIFYVYHVSDTVHNVEDAMVPNLSSFGRDCQSWSWYLECSPFTTKCKIAVVVMRAPSSQLESPK